MSECDSSDQAVSVVVIVVVGVNFLVFRFLSNRCKDVLQILCGCSWGGPLLGVLLLFFMELWVILCNFWPILKKSSSIKTTDQNHSYLVWKVPSGSSF